MRQVPYRPPAPHNYRILVIDDELVVCRSCDRILTEDGYTVMIAQGGREGLEKARTEDFDLALVDLKMPDINGMKVVEILKRERSDMEVIIMTGYATVPSAIEGMKLGAADYIPKPFTPGEMLMAVKKTLSHQKRNVKKPPAGAVIHKEAIIAALKRASEDSTFIARLSELGSKALDEYTLSPTEKAALVSGDVNWLEKHLGKLDQKLSTWLDCRLQQERW